MNPRPGTRVMCVHDGSVWRASVWLSRSRDDYFWIRVDTVPVKYSHTDFNITWIYGWNATQHVCQALLAAAALVK